MCSTEAEKSGQISLVWNSETDTWEFMGEGIPNTRSFTIFICRTFVLDKSLIQLIVQNTYGSSEDRNEELE